MYIFTEAFNFADSNNNYAHIYARFKFCTFKIYTYICMHIHIYMHAYTITYQLKFGLQAYGCPLGSTGSRAHYGVPYVAGGVDEQGGGAEGGG